MGVYLKAALLFNEGIEIGEVFHLHINYAATILAFEVVVLVPAAIISF